MPATLSAVAKRVLKQAVPALQPGLSFGETAAETVPTAAEAAPPSPLPKPRSAGRTDPPEQPEAVSSGLKARARATLEALRLLKTLEAEKRPATDAEKTLLAGFGGFGMLANHIFPQPGSGRYKPGWEALGAELSQLLTPDEYDSAKRSTYNAFYTSPTVMGAIYDGLARLGVPARHVRALEPGCGIGNFIGAAPPGMQFIGVEKEVLSGRIARLLHPDADIRIEPFQKSAIATGSIDIAVGNVPFSDLTLPWRDQKLPLHEYFFARSLDTLHDGGILALVTSRYLLDRKDPSFRTYLAGEADFLGAIRLPKGAFRQEGTEVVTDIVFLRRRGQDKEPAHAAGWLETATLPDGEAQVNRYFLEHPAMVAGELAEDRGMYRNRELTVRFPADYAGKLQQAVTALPGGAYYGTAQAADTQTAIAASTAIPAPTRRLLPGSLLIGPDGAVLTVSDAAGSTEPLQHGGKPVSALSGTVGRRLAALIGIRDAARSVLAAQREAAPQAIKEAARHLLNQRYDAFAAQWGPINRTTITTLTDGSVIRRQPNLTAFKDDPDAYLVMALEQYDEKSGTASKMPIMQQDVIGPAPPVTQVASALDGLLVSLNQRGKADLDYIRTLYGKPLPEILEELGGRVFYDPATAQYVTAEEYLSGNVRDKLRLAREQANTEGMAVSIKALEAAQPEPVPPGDIDIQLGASWIPPAVIQAFIADLLGCDARDITVRHIGKEALWQVEAPAWVTSRVEATSTYGTAERSAITLINDALNMNVPTVTHTVRVDGAERQVPDQEATLAAREKQKAIKAAFQNWLFADPERADRLTERYNQLFNTTRLRHYDGEHLTFPGMNPALMLRPHQKDAVWRVMTSRNALLAHAVGAGKTFEMIASGMKMKQTGLVRKPLYVVPNHMLEQFSREFYQLYPDAKLLIASKEDFTREKRKLLTAKTASGEWDGIIMTHASFEKIGMSPGFQEVFIREQIREYESLLTDMQAGADEGGKRLIKRIEKQKEGWEARLEELANSEHKDSGLTFEDLGVDHLFIDEAHLFKNLETPTKMGQVAGVQTSGSLRAFDLFMKSRYLDRHGHGTTFATGTPVSNSMVEMYTMSRFLAPELLEERGISHFDGWAAVFGDIVDTVELSPDSQSLRQNRRFARFVNLPELLQIFHSFADVKTTDMLHLPSPRLKGGKAEVIATPMSEHQQRVQSSLVARYEQVRSGTVDPREDNALKITTDGRKLALDARLIFPHLPESPGKIDALADQVYAIWQASAAHKATQMIFCDLGVGNKHGQFSVYDAVIRKLTERGIPAQEIANIGDYDTDLKKARLFTRVRSGYIRVLLGSTQKMGTGTNVQQRLFALHHLDAPWKPAEVEQREGRILRQGNQHEEVSIYRYVTEGSFDAYMWQTLQTKAEFINQVMKGDLSIRRMEEMDDQTLSYAEVKAIASGNPAVLTLAKMEIEAQRLTQLARAHRNEQYRIRQTIRQLEDADLPMLAARHARIASDIETIQKHGGLAAPILTLDGGKPITDPRIAQDALREAIQQHWETLAFRLDAAPVGAAEQVTIGQYGGLEIQLALEKGRERVSGTLSLKGQYRTGRALRGPGSDRLLAYLQELAEGLSALRQEVETEHAALETHLDSLQTRLGLPFAHEAKLAQLSAMRSELQSLLQSDQASRPTEPPEAAGTPPNDNATVSSSPAPEAAQDRTKRLVAAFDALMKGEMPPETPLQQAQETPSPRRWADSVRNTLLEPCQNTTKVIV